MMIVICCAEASILTQQATALMALYPLTRALFATLQLTAQVLMDLQLPNATADGTL
jgi:hypothetical protein